MQDIDIADHVPARKASSRLSLIICKFVRRQVKDRVMAAWKEVSKVKVQQAKGFKFCWAKQGSIFLRMTDTSRIHKLNTFQDLQSLQTGEG